MDTQGGGRVDARPAVPVRLMIVEDHPLVRDGVVAALRDAPEVLCVGTAATVAEAAAVAAAARPDVALVDYRLPDGTGADAATAIRDACPHTALAALTAEPSGEALLNMVCAGASAFIAKTVGARDLLDAVVRVAAGETLIPAGMLAEVLAERTRRERAGVEIARAAADLTAREHDVLRLMAEGMDSPRIADRLVISVTTVRWHTRNILEKLEAHSRLEAVARAARLGILAS